MGTVVETTERESILRVLVPALEGDKILIYLQKATATSSVHSNSLGRASHKEIAYYGKNFLSN